MSPGPLNPSQEPRSEVHTPKVGPAETKGELGPELSSAGLLSLCPVHYTRLPTTPLGLTFTAMADHQTD